MFVEIITFPPVRMALSTAGARYASDFPTPVPASTTRCSPDSMAAVTARAISTCSGLGSKSGSDFSSDPPALKISSTAADMP